MKLKIHFAIDKCVIDGIEINNTTYRQYEKKNNDSNNQ